MSTDLDNWISDAAGTIGAEEFARLPPLKLVTIHENPRVAKGVAVDASNLPYLHRNPAI